MCQDYKINCVFVICWFICVLMLSVLCYVCFVVVLWSAKNV